MSEEATKRTLHVWKNDVTAQMMWKAAGSPDNEKHVGAGASMMGVNFHRIVMHEGWIWGDDWRIAVAWRWFEESVLTRRYDRTVAIEFAGADA